MAPLMPATPVPVRTLPLVSPTVSTPFACVWCDVGQLRVGGGLLGSSAGSPHGDRCPVGAVSIRPRAPCVQLGAA